jgi:hypothetical protein
MILSDGEDDSTTDNFMLTRGYGTTARIIGNRPSTF